MNRLPMRERLVNRYLDKVESQLYAREDSFSFRERLHELNRLRMMLETQEKQVYAQLGVKDINELNNKIQQYKGLARLGGKNLAQEIEKLQLFDDTSASLDETLLQIVNSKDFQSIVEKKIQGHTWDEISEEVAIELAQQLKTEGRGSFRIARTLSKSKNKTFGLTKLLKSIVIEAGEIKFKPTSKKDFSPEFISRIQQAFSQAQVEGEENGARAFLTLTEQNRNKYGAWKYTVDQVKNDPSLERQIRDRVLDFCLEKMQGTNEENQAFRRAFNMMPTSSLLVYNTANIQGSIGEVALGAYIDLLTGGQGQGIQVGDVKNALNNNGQISIDFLLGEYGFQVKNYNEFSYGIPNSISLSRTNLLPVWKEKFELNEALSEILDIFYGIRWYNVEYDEEYAETQARIDAIENNIGDFYSRYPDKILRMYEDIKGASIFNTKMLQGRFYNVFYFVSGQKFIPSSQIIQRIIDYFEVNFQPGSLMSQDVYSTSSYTGYNINDFRGKGEYEDAPTLDKIANKVKVQINWRLYLDDFLN